MSYLIAATEREALRLSSRGVSSPIPERYGADFLIVTSKGKAGIQRKRFPEDFFASIDDGRLVREIAMLQSLDIRLLVLEGQPIYTSEGNLVQDGYSRWTRRQIRNLLRSARITHGVDTEWSEDIRDTIQIVEELEMWLRKETPHRSLLTRPKAKTQDTWGNFSRRDWGRYFLQGFPGIGSVVAESIFDTFGRVPLRWDCTKEELRTVPLIGSKRASTLFDLLAGR